MQVMFGSIAVPVVLRLVLVDGYVDVLTAFDSVAHNAYL